MIKGSTELVAIIGSPVQQVKSPENFNRRFGELGVDMAMIAMDVDSQQVSDCVALLRGWRNMRGCVVTVPHKQAFARHMDDLTPRARAIGAVNVFRRSPDGRLSGDMVDGLGFLAAARSHGFEPNGAVALVIGAGGVGSAIAHALCEAGLSRIRILDSDPARVQQLVKILRSSFPGKLEVKDHCTALDDLDLVVNATPVGMNGDPSLPLRTSLLETLAPNALAADVVTSPVMTPWLQFAQGRGNRVQTGPEMALAQMDVLGDVMQVWPSDHPSLEEESA